MICRYEATDMNVYRSAVSACVIMGLPNVEDYIHKHRESLMEEKRQKLLALSNQRLLSHNETSNNSGSNQDQQNNNNQSNIINRNINSVNSNNIVLNVNLVGVGRNDVQAPPVVQDPLPMDQDQIDVE